MAIQLPQNMSSKQRPRRVKAFYIIYSAFAVIVVVSAVAILMNLHHHHHDSTTEITAANNIISSSLLTSKTTSSSSAVQLAPFPSHNNKDETSWLTILPHELPGYTGWARPLYTLVDSFSVVGYSANVATVGQDWNVTVECKHEKCTNGGALFYIRAYGRSLLPGRVVDHQNGQYTVTILPHDAGRYTLEVVLAISNKPNWEDLPITGRSGEPSYEGYLLPGFPLLFTVVEPRKKQTTKEQPAPRHLNTDLPLCRARQLLETSTDSALSTGRWLVVNKTRAFPYPRSLPYSVETMLSFQDTEQINIDTYINSLASVGYQMDYFHNDCNVLSLDQIANKTTWHDAINQSALEITPKKHLHLLFIGDSNTRNQYNFFRDHVAKPTSYMGGCVKHTYIDMMGVWSSTFNHTREMLHDITTNPDTQNDHFFVVFNVGLHEITNRCSINGLRKKLKLEGKCHEVYQKDVQQLLDLLQQMLPHAVVKIWQSTTAGWPKWGLFGVAWPQHTGQKLPREPNFCGYINDLAWPIVQNNDGNGSSSSSSSKNDVHVMDMYWLTLSRPDHREVIEKDAQRTSYKLVHLGPEVYSILVRKFVTIILEAVTNVKKSGVPYNPLLL